MKKIIFLLIIIMVATVSFAEGETPILKFWVMSDIHSAADAFDKALKDAWKQTPDYDLLILNGDLVDIGQIEDYEGVMTVLNNAREGGIVPEAVEFNIGNHEYYYAYGTGAHGRKYTDILQGRYFEYSGRDDYWHTVELKKIGFISLGSEVTYNKYENKSTVSAVISDMQMEWFEDEVKKYSSTGKPTFVFLHQPLDDTVYFSRFYKGNVDKDSEIKKILSENSNMFFISSHSHEAFENGGNFYQDESGYVCIDSSSVVRTAETSDKGHHEQTLLENTGQMLYVEVYSDKVVLKARDFVKDCWIDNAFLTVDLK
ncbi:MAG TPA: metallophosphoesterase [Thermotogota bacterium]|nr:metallophosphoesterase [Thermotogota bacterium]